MTLPRVFPSPRTHSYLRDTICGDGPTAMHQQRVRAQPAAHPASRIALTIGASRGRS
jgi:hypothetical protein